MTGFKLLSRDCKAEVTSVVVSSDEVGKVEEGEEGRGSLRSLRRPAFLVSLAWSEESKLARQVGRHLPRYAVTGGPSPQRSGHIAPGEGGLLTPARAKRPRRHFWRGRAHLSRRGDCQTFRHLGPGDQQGVKKTGSCLVTLVVLRLQGRSHILYT